MSEHETLIFGSMIFIGLMFVLSKMGGGRALPTRPKTPEPLTGPQRFFQEMPETSFDASAFQTARSIIANIEGVTDLQSKTLLLADHIHRLDQTRTRQTDRMTVAQKQEADILEKALALADRFSGRQTPPPPPPAHGGYYPENREPRRINNWDPNRRQIPEQW